jgi:sulfur-oxidizing protein SoxY
MKKRGLNRRVMIGAAAALGLGPRLAVAQVSASGASVAESFAASEAAILAGRIPAVTGIAIEMPPLSENGNAVDLAIKVSSPMTAQDHIRRIHVLAEKNPFPHVATFHLGPRAGRAEVATRIRLSETQDIVVLAETSAGQVIRARQEVIVILGACIDGG